MTALDQVYRTIADAGPHQSLRNVNLCGYTLATLGQGATVGLSKSIRFLVGRLFFLNLRAPNIAKTIEVSILIPMLVESTAHAMGPVWGVNEVDRFALRAASTLEYLVQSCGRQRGVEDLLTYFLGAPWKWQLTPRERASLIAIVIPSLLAVCPFLSESKKAGLLTNLLDNAGIFSNEPHALMLAGLCLKEFSIIINELRNENAVQSLGMWCGREYFEPFLHDFRQSPLCTCLNTLAKILAAQSESVTVVSARTAIEVGLKTWGRLMGVREDVYIVDTLLCHPMNIDLYPEVELPGGAASDPYLRKTLPLTQEANVLITLLEDKADTTRTVCQKMICMPGTPDHLCAELGANFRTLKRSLVDFGEVIQCFGCPPPLSAWPRHLLSVEALHAAAALAVSQPTPGREDENPPQPEEDETPPLHHDGHSGSFLAVNLLSTSSST